MPATTPITVRAAASGDGRPMADAWRDGGRFYATLSPSDFQVPAAHLADTFEEVIERGPGADATWLVAEITGAVVGCAFGHLTRPVDRPEIQLLRELAQTQLHVDALMVNEQSRRRGVGKALMTALETGRNPRRSLRGPRDLRLKSLVRAVLRSARLLRS